MPRSVAEAEGVAYFVPFVPDEQVTTEIDGTAYLAAKTAAMRAHATQIAVDGDRFALSNGRWQPLLGRSTTHCLAGGHSTLRDTPDPMALEPPGAPGWPGCRADPGTREHDLFAGLDGR